MVDYELIYRERPADYHRLVSAEDREGNLLPAIEGVVRVEGADIVEVGAGTGRLTRLLASRAARVRAFDRSQAMLDEAFRGSFYDLTDRCALELACADAATLPVADASADLVVAGWVFGHLRSWDSPRWKESIGDCLREMDRVVRRGGALLILETLGTGTTEPDPPTPELAEYYGWLEADHGFTRTWLRTDYAFPWPEDAAELTTFFFGKDLSRGSTHVPECTGLWYKQT
jgi:SAM-dependent methyltransferase